MTIPVVWLSYRDDVDPRKQWDTGLLQRVFDQTLWSPAGGRAYSQHNGFDEFPATATGAVVVLPGQHHVDFVDELNEDLAALDWVVLLLIGDECSLFPVDEICHPNMKLWIMTPRPQLHAPIDARFIGEGWKYDTPDLLADVRGGKRFAWFFAGQINHERREQMATVLHSFDVRSDELGRGQLVETPGFTQGLDRREYLREMAGAQVVPCPAGPGTPDSFRLYEALEAGCLPVADAVTPEGWTGYWDLVYGDVPFPVIEDWAMLPDVLAEVLPDIVDRTNRASAWWQQYKRMLAYWLQDDVAALTGGSPSVEHASDLITVLIPTSPTPSNPSTAIIEETILSIRAQPDLADAEIIVMVDGVRPEQEDRRAAYECYVSNLLRLTGRSHNVVPVLAPEWLHQANLTKLGLMMVRTPCVLFVEHDTPLVPPSEGTVPWGELCGVIDSGAANVIRLHHEAAILEPHRHLMPDDKPQRVDGVPLLRCAQWSQRPHLASTEFYTRMLVRYFGARARTMIEDSIHGVLSELWKTRGLGGWDEFRLWMYAPRGSMKRSYHTDGRAGDPKFEMDYEYDGDTVPEGAPYPTSKRVD